MTVRYPCDQCGKDFNFRIKLNKHVARIHKEQQGSTDDHFLQSGVILTDLQKINYFDKLSEKFQELCSKFSNSEKKFDFLQRKLKSLEKVKCKSKRSEQSKKFVGSSNASGSYEKILNDPHLPGGWQSAYKKMDSSFSKDKKIKIYWAPNGRCCSSRREAMNYMIEHESSSSDKEIMRQGFYSDNWMYDESLPKGWLYKVGSDSRMFLTDDYTILKGPRAGLKYMAAKHSDQEIAKFICKHSLRNDATALNIQFMISDSIPFPWRVGSIAFNSGTKGQIITSPDGKTFNSLKNAVEYIEKFGKMEKTEFEIFVNFVRKSKYQEKLTEDNWVPDDTLPTGWRKIKKDKSITRYLSPSGETFGNRFGAIEYLKKYEGIEIKPKEKIVKIAKIKPERIEFCWQFDGSVPENWMIAVTDGGGVKFKDPKGTVLRDRTEALRSMSSDSSCKEEDFKIMKSGLITVDGWIIPDFLPTGWMLRSRKKFNRGGKNMTICTVYLSPQFETLHSFESVFQHLKKSGSSETELQYFKEHCPYKWKKGNFLPEGWMYSKGKHYKGKYFNIYLSPSGRYFAGVLPVMRDYQEKFENPSDKNMFISLMFDNGWLITEYLPPGWMFKPKNHKGGMIYSSPEYVVLKNTKKLLKFMEKQGINPQVISTFRRNCKNLISTKPMNGNKEISTVADNSNGSSGLSWTFDPDLPQGWKTAVTEITKGPFIGRTCYRFMSTDGTVFGNRVEAFKALYSWAKDENVLMQFKKGFYLEGWKEKEYLPENWLVRELSSGSSYMTPSGEVFVYFEIVLAYMIENDYSPEEIDTFENQCGHRKLPNRTNKQIKQEQNMDKTNISTNLICLKEEACVLKVLDKKANIQDLLPHVTVSRLKNENLLKPKKKMMPESKCSYDWKPQNSLPTGWNSTVIESTLGILKDMKFKRYLSPEGRIFGSIPQALRSLISNTNLNENEIDGMKKGLPEEGWFCRDFLPAGWMIKKLNHGSCIVLTDEFETFKSIRKVVASMNLKQFKNEVIERVKEGMLTVIKEVGGRKPSVSSDTLQIAEQKSKTPEKRKTPDADESYIGGNTTPLALKKIKSERIDERIKTENPEEDWTSGGDTLPKGWKIRKNNSLNVVQYLSTKNNVFKSRAEAFKLCSKSGKYTATEINEIRNKLHHEFWEDHNLLPEGWKLKKIEGGAIFFLSETGSLIRTVRGARENIKKKSEKQEMDNFTSLIDELKPTNKENKASRNPPPIENPIYVNNDLTDTAPAITQIKKEKDPVEATCSSTKYMDTEGWLLGDESLPPGWRKKFHKNLFDYKYLTEEMTKLNSSEEAFKHVSGSGEYNQEEVNKFEIWFSEVKKLMPSIKWVCDESLPIDWKLSSGLEFDIIRDRKGALFESRKEAIDQMIKEHYSPTDIFNLWNTLHLQGWINDEEHLPTGWKRKFYPKQNVHHYLSPMMEVVESAETLLKLVKESKDYSEEEVKKVELWMEKLN